MTKRAFDPARLMAETRIRLRPLATHFQRLQHARAAEAKAHDVAHPDSAPTRPAPPKPQAHRPEPPRRAAPQPAKPQPRHAAKPNPKAEAKGKKTKAKPKPPTGRIEAVGWFALAAVILAWPHRNGLLGKSSDPDAPPLFPGLSKATSQTQVAVAAAREPGRGRGAHSPRQIPLEGWKDILARTWHDFNQDRITAVAAGVTFFGLLALFPALGAFVSLYGLFADVGAAQKQLTSLAGVLPGGALTVIGDQMKRLTQAPHSGLGFAFVVGLLTSLWSANAGMKALFDGLNVAFEEKEKRNFIKLNLISLAFTVASIVLLLLALGAMVVLPVAMNFVGLSGGDSVIAALRWPLLFVLVVLGIAALYRYGPSRSHEKWKWVTWGSVISAVAWLLVSLAFSAYVSHFGNYDKTYGSLGAVIGFMTWMWISAIVILFGAELNSEIEHQTAVDTTDGLPKPMGTRGAKMADTIGEARKPKPKK